MKNCIIFVLIELTPCDSSPCKNGGTCTDTDDGKGYKCQCRVCNCSPIDLDANCLRCMYFIQVFTNNIPPYFTPPQKKQTNNKTNITL